MRRGLVFAAGAFLVFSAWLVSRSIRPPVTLESAARIEYGVLPDVTLLDARDRSHRIREVEAPWVAAFLFTRCRGQCPLILENLAALHARARGVRFVAVGVDPRDGKKELEAYARKAPWLLFLRGERDAVRSLCKEGFKLPLSEGGGALEPIVHSSRLVLVGAGGRVLGYYDGLDGAELERLGRDARSAQGFASWAP